MPCTRYMDHVSGKQTGGAVRQGSDSARTFSFAAVVWLSVPVRPTTALRSRVPLTAASNGATAVRASCRSTGHRPYPTLGGLGSRSAMSRIAEGGGIEQPNVSFLHQRTHTPDPNASLARVTKYIHSQARLRQSQPSLHMTAASRYCHSSPVESKVRCCQRPSVQSEQASHRAMPVRQLAHQGTFQPGEGSSPRHGASTSEFPSQARLKGLASGVSNGQDRVVAGVEGQVRGSGNRHTEAGDQLVA